MGNDEKLTKFDLAGNKLVIEFTVAENEEKKVEEPKQALIGIICYL